MKHDIERMLIPHSDTVHMIEELQKLAPRLKDAAHQLELLDGTGHVPASPDFSVLIHHAETAQVLARDVVHLTSGFAKTPHSTNRAGSAVLSHLATAATMSCSAAPLFAETAEIALALPRSHGTSDRQRREGRMVIHHATARAYLRRASESLDSAVKELNEHLGLHRFFPSSMRQGATPPPPPSMPNPRTR
ncbi:hypothetical protein GCM10010211_20010 [Streptomyces albospinus]|uniref:Uncharacterized protein n=1 Tax=Streptomyces albospinus TaxID=285515 RepID=A0ABQ2UVA1_9ACTN|nr:hypothetical protein [Streptomyces albospinus]GGU55310.1 hypothetical protein GCM10010211_20010 [Streptomyces albospinus]